MLKPFLHASEANHKGDLNKGKVLEYVKSSLHGATQNHTHNTRGGSRILERNAEDKDDIRLAPYIVYCDNKSSLGRLHFLPHYT